MRIREVILFQEKHQLICWRIKGQSYWRRGERFLWIGNICKKQLFLSPGFQLSVSLPEGSRCNHIFAYQSRYIKWVYYHTVYSCGITLCELFCTLFSLIFWRLFHVALLFLMVASYSIYNCTTIYLTGLLLKHMYRTFVTIFVCFWKILLVQTVIQ